jgi:hypothetical protein
MFRNKINFFLWEVVSPTPNPQAGWPLLSSFLFWLFLYSQLTSVSCSRPSIRDPGKRHAAVTGNHQTTPIFNQTCDEAFIFPKKPDEHSRRFIWRILSSMLDQSEYARIKISCREVQGVHTAHSYLWDSLCVAWVTLSLTCISFLTSKSRDSTLNYANTYYFQFIPHSLLNVIQTSHTILWIIEGAVT